MKPIEEPECPECRRWKAMQKYDSSVEAGRDDWVLISALSSAIGALVVLLLT